MTTNEKKTDEGFSIPSNILAVVNSMNKAAITANEIYEKTFKMLVKTIEEKNELEKTLTEKDDVIKELKNGIAKGAKHGK